jgi:NADPH-dependent 2,4-dienoyl-CoA reductase/sulfur reductase-like enzyme/rhodanese-related sulfurtransferase
MAKILIVGGVAGGMSAAARLRRNSETDEIIVFERGEYVSFANCGLPYYIGGEIQDREELFLQTPESFHTRFNVDVRAKNEVLSIDRKEKAVKVKDLSTGETYKETYDKLVLSPGAKPVVPGIPGINHPAIFRLRNVPDTDAIKKFIDEKRPKEAAVVGGGFIGLEMAENLARLGIKVTIVEALPQVMSPLDPDMAEILHSEITANKVGLRLSDGVAEFSDEKGRARIKLASGAVISADIVILSIGVAPESTLAEEAGLKLGERKSIEVDEFMQTSDPDIYAAGDAVQVTHRVTGTKAVIPMAGPANKQGRIAADNIAYGNKTAYKGAFGAGIARVFRKTAAVTGANEAALKKAGIDYRTVTVHPGNHAGYYPGAERLSFKLLFSMDGRILGAQAVGGSGADKRIDVISAYMAKGGTVYDLAEFEQAYAPPFSSAKDVINMAGFAAENLLTGKVNFMTWQELLKDKEGHFILDVRTAGEVAQGKVLGSVNIPVDSLRNRLDQLPKDKKIAVYCASGVRSAIAARMLQQLGYKQVYNVSGGFMSYPKQPVKK